MSSWVRAFCAIPLLHLTCLTFLCVLRVIALYVPPCFTHFRMPYVPYLRALSMHLTHLLYSPYEPYLHILKSFKDELVVHQMISIFQGLLKALQTVLFLCSSKSSQETF